MAGKAQRRDRSVLGGLFGGGLGNAENAIRTRTSKIDAAVTKATGKKRRKRKTRAEMLSEI